MIESAKEIINVMTQDGVEKRWDREGFIQSMQPTGGFTACLSIDPKAWPLGAPLDQMLSGNVSLPNHSLAFPVR